MERHSKGYVPKETIDPIGYLSKDFFLYYCRSNIMHLQEKGNYRTRIDYHADGGISAVAVGPSTTCTHDISALHAQNNTLPRVNTRGTNINNSININTNMRV